MIDLPTHPFTYDEARDLGLTRSELHQLVETRVLRRVLTGVYQRTDIPDTVESRVKAAALVISPFGVFVDRTAAWLWDVDVLAFRETELLPPIECVVLRGRCQVERRECKGGARYLAPFDITTLMGVRLTTPLRTALDLGCLLAPMTALAALDMFARKHGVGHEQLTGALPRYRRRRGVVQLRMLVPLVDARSESVRESMLRFAVIDEGFPVPQPQVWVQHQGVDLFRLDLAYPRHRVAIEYDGEWHDATPEKREADRVRRQWLRDNGWTVIVVKRGELAGRGRQRWVRELRDALGL